MACFVYGWWAPHRREAVETVRGVLRSARGPVSPDTVISSWDMLSVSRMQVGAFAAML